MGQEIYRALLNASEENRGTVLNTIRDVTEAELSHGDADAPSVAAASELALLWDEDQEWTRDIVPATDGPKVFDDAFRAKHGPLYDQLAHREASLAVFLSAHDPNWDDLKILQTHGLEPLLSTNWSSLFNLGRGTRVGNLLNIFSQQEDWTDRDLALVGEHLSRMPLPWIAGFQHINPDDLWRYLPEAGPGLPENSEVDDNVLFLAFAIGAIIIESTAANDSDSRWPGRPRFIEFLGEPECRKDPSSRLVPLWQMRLRTTDKKAWAIDWKAIGFSTEQQELARAWTVGEISFVGSEPHDESSSSAPEPQMD